MNLDSERDRLLGLADKATPGPWWHAKMDSPDGNALAWISNWFVDTERPRPKGAVSRYLRPEDDAAFLAAAHDMIALIRAQAAEIERLKGRDER